MKFSFLPTLLLNVILLFAPPARAQDVHTRLYGGDFATLDTGPVALILTSTFQCTGILVGPREVLTAAHCTAENIRNSEYEVLVGGTEYRVSARYYNRNYDPVADAEVAAPHDLGILLLDRSVSGTSPVPVLAGNPVAVGDSVSIYGYGANELSGRPGRDPREEGKVGQAIITKTSGGLLTSNNNTAGASVCSGDSGGPMIRSVDGASVVVGTLSVGMNQTRNGYCFLAGDGEFDYVNLQSATSRSFLANFAGVTYYANDTTRLRSESAKLASKIRSAVKSRSAFTLVRKVGPILLRAKGLRAYASGDDAAVLNQAIRQLRAVSKARSLSSARSSLRKALVLVELLYIIGVV
jgi:hypothetical protein